MAKVRDTLTLDLFEVPIPKAPLPGALGVGVTMRHLISDLLKASPLSRFQVAARMSEMTGQEITKYQLDSWTAESREGWRFPLEYLPALEEALCTHAVTAWLADVRGGRLLVGEEALQAELGKIDLMEAELARQKKAIKKLMENKR